MGGQENVENSKWLNFELRTYNADLGRFNIPDPYSQFASAYVGMGNNPVSGVDPSGGYMNFGVSSAQFEAQQKQSIALHNQRYIAAYFDQLDDIYSSYYSGGSRSLSPEGSLALWELKVKYGGFRENIGLSGGGSDIDKFDGEAWQAEQNAKWAGFYSYMEKVNSFMNISEPVWNLNGVMHEGGGNGVQSPLDDLDLVASLYGGGMSNVAGGNLALGSLLAHYIDGSGDNYYLNQSSFNGLISELSQNNALNFKNRIPAPGVDGLYQIQISTYGTSYENAAGYATLYFNNSGVVGYSDWWNFESHSNGDRSWWNETKTKIGSTISGTPFWVLYGITPSTDQIPIH